MLAGRKRLLILSAIFVVAILLLIAWQNRHLVADIDINAWVEWIASFGPLPFFLAMSILPAFWIPVSPFLLLAGFVYPLPVAIVGSLAALSANMAMCWLFAGVICRPFFERLVTRFGYTVPRLSNRSMMQAAFLLRITPGMPFPFQNYSLGLARMPFNRYMLISVPTMSFMCVSIIIFGDALLKGDGAMILGAIALIVMVAIVVSRVRSHFKQRQIREAS